MSSASQLTPFLPFLPALLQCIALNQHFAQIASGVIYPTDLGYFLVFVTVFLSATAWLLAHRKGKRR